MLGQKRVYPYNPNGNRERSRRARTNNNVMLHVPPPSLIHGRQAVSMTNQRQLDSREQAAILALLLLCNMNR